MLTEDVKMRFYNMIERLSDKGLQLSTKYETKMKFIRAHIVVASNQEPDETLIPKRCFIIKADLN